jgi:membrane-anchored protein YejM (alkaline phosphatase superfamily)
VFDALGGDVLFDDGEIDSDRFPNLAELSRDSAVFTNASSNQMDTGFSVTTMLSGKFVSEIFPARGRENDDHVAETLLGLLVDEGYSVEFHSSILDCPSKKLVCRDRALYSTESSHVAANDFVDWFLPTEAVRRIRRLVLKLLPTKVSSELLTLDPAHRGDLPLWNGFLGKVNQSEANGRFFFIHSFVSHHPYEWDRDGNQIRTSSATDSDFEALGLAYQEQVMFLDSLVGDFVTKLKVEDLFDDSLIIITGDHGPRRLGLRHSNIAWEQTAQYPAILDRMVPWVPLIIKGRGISPNTYSTDYQHLDLLPTVLELLGNPIPPNLEGVSAFSSSRPDRQKIFHTYPIVEGRVTYIYDADDGQWQRAD